jgi:hypothetical protein
VYHPVIGIPVFDGDNLGIPDRRRGVLLDGVINGVVTMLPHKAVGVTVHVKFAFIPVNGNSLPVYFFRRENRMGTHKTKKHTYKTAFFHGYLQNLNPPPALVRGSGGLLFIRLGAKAQRQIAVFPVICHTVTAFCVVGAIHIRAGTLFHIGTRHVLSPLRLLVLSAFSKQEF